MEDRDTITNYVTKIRDLVDQLPSTKEEIDSRNFMSTILNNVAPSYAPFVIVLRFFTTSGGDHAKNDATASFDYVVGLLLQ